MDQAALEVAGRRLQPFGHRVELIHSSFRHLRAVLSELGISRVDGVLFDLGVSSHQLDQTTRGFRFSGEGIGEAPLDMRMDRRAPRTAADLLNSASAEQLAAWFRDYGDLRGAARLARAIERARQRAPLRRAGDLLELIAEARVGGGRRHHPATRVFQALRIAVNDELGALGEGLEAAIEVIDAGGRLVVLAYHSAEDRMVKNRLREAARGCSCPPSAPVCVCGGAVRLRLLTRRPVRPGKEEVRENPRARSARLRAAERVAQAA
jgi:16S rRNA (cytosine1402-N4)-methyltransferase